MTEHQIDISPDPSKPDGGHAIALVRAVTAMPEPPDFSVSALLDNPDDNDTAEAWSFDDQPPLEARLTDDGLELRIGPDLVDAPQLQPGTPVIFAIPAANVRAELSWPDLPVTIPPDLPDPVMDPALLRALKIENAQRAAAEAEAEEALKSTLATSVVREPASRQGPNGTTPLDVDNLADISAAIDKTKIPLTSATKKTAELPRHSIPLNLAVDPGSDAPLPAKLDTGTVRSKTSLTPQRNDSRSSSHEVVAAHQDGGRGSRRWLSIVLALIAVPAMLFAFWPSISSRISGQTAVTGATERLASSDWVTRILAVGDISPEGVDASSVSANDALTKAEAAIFGANEASLAERKFWLRKSIALMLAEPESRWAVTQLGALHTGPAAPGQQPDYRTAKTLWEIASASGDTVATCFLAQLYELGLGVIASKEKAQQWHERAARRGGCNVQHERPTPTLTN